MMCSFAESILAAHSTKAEILKMRSKRSGKDLSCLEWWLQDTLKNIVGTFPIIFDKTCAFTTPLYGFDEDMDASHSTHVGAASSTDDATSFRSNSTLDAFELELLEALQKYEKTGALSMSVVIDTSPTPGLRVEAGFSLVERGTVDKPSDPDANTRLRFPAVFMRTLSSSTEVPPPPRPPHPITISPKGLLGRPQEHSWKDRLNAGSSPMPSSPSGRKVLGSWSTEEATASAKKKKSIHALEYGPEAGHGGTGASWPHSEWSTLVSLLTEIGNEGNSAQGETLDGLDSRSVARGPRVSYSNHTLYCVESVCDSMWMVAMFKSSELPRSEWGWQTPLTPTTETVEDDLRELVANLTSTIRISGRFEAASVRLLRDKFLDRSSDDIGAGLCDEVKERGFEEGKIKDEGVCRLVKNQIRVLTQVSMSNVEPGTSIIATQSRLLGRRRRMKGQNRPVGHSESAAALFLGRELMSTLIDW
jgi:hypothetical protein